MLIFVPGPALEKDDLLYSAEASITQAESGRIGVPMIPIATELTHIETYCLGVRVVDTARVEH